MVKGTFRGGAVNCSKTPPTVAIEIALVAPQCVGMTVLRRRRQKVTVSLRLSIPTVPFMHGIARATLFTADVPIDAAREGRLEACGTSRH